MRRRWLVVLAVVAAVAVAGVAFVLVRDDGGSGPGLPDVPADPALGLRRAVEACSELRQVEALVRANGAAEDVFAAADRAVEAGRLAAGHDVRWVALSSGIEAVRVGLKKNDGQAANVGIRSARAQCDTVDAEAGRQ